MFLVKYFIFSKISRLIYKNPKYRLFITFIFEIRLHPFAPDVRLDGNYYFYSLIF